MCCVCGTVAAFGVPLVAATHTVTGSRSVGAASNRHNNNNTTIECICALCATGRDTSFMWSMYINRLHIAAIAYAFLTSLRPIKKFIDQNESTSCRRFPLKFRFEEFVFVLSYFHGVFDSLLAACDESIYA